MKNLKKIKEVYEEDLCDNVEEVFETVRKNCLNNKFLESCGFVGIKNNRYIVQNAKNISTNPREEFLVDPLDYLSFKDKNKLISVYHSHIDIDEKPSEYDILISENCCVPFMIYSVITDKIGFYVPSNLEFEKDLIEDIKNNI